MRHQQHTVWRDDRRCTLHCRKEGGLTCTGRALRMTMVTLALVLTGALVDRRLYPPCDHAPLLAGAATETEEQHAAYYQEAAPPTLRAGFEDI